MNTDTMMRTLDEALPDALIEEEIRSILREGQRADGLVPIEINEQIVLVPFDTRIEILTKTFVKENYDIGFLTGYRAQAAVGGVAGGKGHDLKANYCFATLFFNRDRRRFTVDFHASAAWL